MFLLDYIRIKVLDMLLSNLVFSLRLPNIIGLNYQRMLILLTYKEPINMFFDTVLRVKIFVEGRGVSVHRRSSQTESNSNRYHTNTEMKYSGTFVLAIAIAGSPQCRLKFVNLMNLNKRI